MLLATLLLFACNSDVDGTPTDDTDVVTGTATRPIVEPVDSARDSGGTTGDTQVATQFETSCTNEQDDDDDGLVDCLDPDCALSPACSNEICDDGIDNDANGLTDCMEPACADEPSCDTSCVDEVLVDPLPITFTGTTAGGQNDTTPTCGYSNAADRAYAFVAPTDGVYTFDTFGTSWDTVLYVYNGCLGQEVECNDDSGSLQSRVSGPMTAGQLVIIVVDGYSGNQGNFRLNVSN